MANHIRVITAIIFSQLLVLYFGFRMDVSLTELLTDLLIFKGGDFLAFILWQVTFVVLVSIIIMASNNAPDA